MAGERNARPTEVVLPAWPGHAWPLDLLHSEVRLGRQTTRRGGLSNLERLYKNVPKLWGAEVFPDQVTTQFLKNSHGDASGVRGAAWLW